MPYRSRAALPGCQPRRTDARSPGVQDAACGLAGVPLLLVDEWNASTPSRSGRAMEFLSAAAEDYEAVLCCYTGELPVSVPSGVWVWLAAGGKLHRC